jgi:predicted O-methyltransferase YrrM
MLVDSPARAPVFERLVWQSDRMLLDDLVFRIEHAKSENWELGDACFALYKTKYLVDQYARFWASRPAFRPENILELGLWDGGSLALWYECFRPRKCVGVDVARRGDSDYFRQYVASRGLQNAMTTFWGVNQADADQLQDIVAREFDGPLDLVIDDASHKYAPTRASFEALFPLLRPGGLYVVEDWAWEHWAGFQSPDHRWARETSLTTFLCQLVEATGSTSRLISNLSVFQGFVVVERGEAKSQSLHPFSIERFISRRPPSRPASLFRRVLEALK